MPEKIPLPRPIPPQIEIIRTLNTYTTTSIQDLPKLYTGDWRQEGRAGFENFAHTRGDGVFEGTRAETWCSAQVYSRY